jgi:radical SAM superfamily enzyme YgiQ (UPF0313 family)
MTDILKIKLVSPKMSLRPMDSEFKRLMSPSLSLVTLASLTPKPHIVYIEDENLNPINFSDNPDIVGITVNVDTTYRAFDIAKIYRDKGIRVIFGGIHASSNPDSMLEHCDSVCIGEAEEVWGTILDDFSNGTLKLKYFYSEPTDLKKVPLPDWNLISKNSYLYNNIIVTSRGCPFQCEFCYNSCDYTNKKFRFRPIESVLKEINALDNKRIMFIDDNLIGNLDWTEELLKNIKPLNLYWHAAVSTNIVKYPDLIQRMSGSGCKSLFIGFESINNKSIKSIRKTQNIVGEYNTLVNLLHYNGIMVNASLVFGFDHDTKGTFDQTLDWLISNKIETMTAHILTPYPGTKIYTRLLRENRIVDFDLNKYNTSNVVFLPKNMTPVELKEGYLKIYKDFYSFRNIIKRKPDNKKLIAPFFIFNLGYRKFGKSISKVGKAGYMSKIGRLGSTLSYGLE